MKTSKLKDAITKQYETKVEPGVREMGPRTVSLNFHESDAAMLIAIAAIFGKSTAAFGGEIFSPLVADLFNSLSPEDQTKAARAADVASNEYRKSKARKGETVASKAIWQTRQHEKV